MAKSKGASIETVLKAVVSLGERMATKDDLRSYATKNEVEEVVDSAKEEILKELRPIARAVDKDAEVIVKHEKRITRIESHLAIK